MSKSKVVTNPNGANQYKADPRQAVFLASFLDPKSKTYSNALQSALKAGFAQEYAENITAQMPKWLLESLGDNELIKKAEQNLKEFLELDIVERQYNREGELISETINPQIGKLKQNSTHFTLERLNKAKYAQKSELDVRATVLNITELYEKTLEKKENEHIQD